MYRFISFIYYKLFRNLYQSYLYMSQILFNYRFAKLGFDFYNINVDSISEYQFSLFSFED